MKKIVAFLVTTIVWFFVGTAFAQVYITSPTPDLPGAPAGVGTEAQGVAATTILPGIIAYVIGITAVLAIIAITWAGIQMFLSVGNEEKFNQARNILLYALIGVGLAGCAYLIVNVISNLSFT